MVGGWSRGWGCFDSQGWGTKSQGKKGNTKINNEIAQKSTNVYIYVCGDKE